MVKKALLKSAANYYTHRGKKYLKSEGVQVLYTDKSRISGYKLAWEPKKIKGILKRGGEGGAGRKAEEKQLIINEMNKLDPADLGSMTKKHLGQFMKSRLPGIKRDPNNVHLIRNEVIGGKVGARENWLTREQNLSLDKFLREDGRYKGLFDTQVQEQFPDIGVRTIAAFRKSRGLTKTETRIGPMDQGKTTILKMLKDKYGKVLDEDQIYFLGDDSRGFFVAEGKP